MRVLLISANREEINMPTWPLGLACIASATEAAGHHVGLVDLKSTDDPRQVLATSIREHQPEIIGISVRNIDDQNMETRSFMLEQVRQVVTDCRAESGSPMVLGGAGYSIFPQDLLDYLNADMGIQGEGEKTFPDLLGRIERGERLHGLNGLYLRGSGTTGKREFVRELDNLPLPNAQTASLALYNAENFWFPVQTRRGCPLNCVYCSTGTIEGRVIRKRSPKAFLAWLTQWIDVGVRRFYFVDNTFNLPPSYARELCAGLIDLGSPIQWRCILYPGNINETLVKLMAGAGCVEVSLGFESGSARILPSLNKRFGLEDVRLASRLLADYGIRRMGFLLLGVPGETKETVEESLVFADSLNLDAVKVTVGIRIYPYTELARIALKEGLVRMEDDLLSPTFYLTKGLDGWLQQTVKEWISTRPNWLR